MDYEILEGIKPKLNKVTPKAIKFYKERGLLDPKNFSSEGVLEILVTKEIVVQWLDVLFKLTPEELEKCAEKFEELDYEQVFRAHNDFFGKLWKPSSP